MRRRDLLTGVVAAGATAVVGAGTASAVTPPDDVELSLFRLPQAAPMQLPRLVDQIVAARRDFCATEYTRLGHVLPSLIA